MTLTNDIIATEWESAIERYESATKAIELEVPPSCPQTLPPL